jgi:hypothetical protein
MPEFSGLAGMKIQKITGPKLDTIAGFRSLQILAPHIAPSCESIFCLDRQLYQNVSRETFWYNWRVKSDRFSRMWAADLRAFKTGFKRRQPASAI